MGWLMREMIHHCSPEVYGLEHDVPADRVTHAEVGHGRSGSVRLEFRDPDDSLQDVTLYLQNPAEFVKAFGQADSVSRKGRSTTRQIVE
jgi:hypothetical protein